MPVYIISMVFTHSSPTPFFLHSEGGFSCGKAASEKAIKNSQTVHHKGRYHLCSVCSMSHAVFLSGMGWLFLICAQPNPPTDKPQIEWRGGGWVAMVIVYCGAQTPACSATNSSVVHNLIPGASAVLKRGHILIVCGNPKPGQWLESVRNALGW